LVTRGRTESPARIVERLAGDAYDAAVHDMPWEAALTRLAAALNADAATFVLFDPRRAIGGYSCAVDIPERLQRDYAAHYWKVDPLRLGAEKLGNAPGVAVTDDMLVPPRDLLASEGYNDGMKPYGLRYFLGGALSCAGSAGTALGLLRRAAGAGFGNEEVAAMSALLPRWQRAVSVHWALAAVQGPWPLLLSAEDAAGRGVVVVDGGKRIVSANRCAERHLSDAASIRACVGRLVARDGAAERLLRRAITAALDPAARSAAVDIAAPRTDGAALRLRVMPVPPNRLGTGRPRCALVLIDEPEADRARSVERFARRHGLTGAEHALLAQLAAGRSLAEAASRLGRSVSTARNQLQMIFAKSETHRQSELIARVLSAAVE
jgi:DNA-binding CsgD family transcriptional regulator